MAVYAYNPVTWELEAGWSRVQVYPQLYREFKDWLEYMRPGLKDKKQ